MNRPLDATAVIDGADRPYRYAAFISYRHVEPDRKWAKWLHSALETYRVPSRLAREHGLPARVGRCFRDEDELPASDNLAREIDQALQESRFLVVICSPRITSSRWCNKEVERFRELGRHDRILSLLVDGEPSESFLPALREIRTTLTDATGMTREQIQEVEPLAADVRRIRGDSQRHMRQMAKLRLLAQILGVRFDDLRQRENERHGWRLAALASGALGLAAVLAALSIFALFQRWEANENAATAQANEVRANLNARRANNNAEQEQIERIRADKNRDEAVKERAMAELGRAQERVSEGDAYALLGKWLDAKARYKQAREDFIRLNEDPLTAELGLVAAYMHSPPALNVMSQPIEQRDDPAITIFYGIQGRNHNAAIGHAESVTSLAVSDDGRVAFAGVRHRQATVWDLATGRILHRMGSGIGGEPATDISSDGTRGLTGGAEGDLALWDLTSGAKLKSIDAHLGPIYRVALSTDGTTALSGAYGGDVSDHAVRGWDLASGRELFEVKTEVGVDELAISPDNKTAFAQAWDGVRAWRMSDGHQIALDTREAGRLFGVSAADHLLLLQTYEKGKPPSLWDASSGLAVESFPVELRPSHIKCSPDGVAALYCQDGGVRLANLTDGTETFDFVGHEDDFHTQPVACDGGRLAVSGNWDRTIRVWPLYRGTNIRGHVTPAASAPPKSALLGPDCRLAVTVAASHFDLWDLATGFTLRDAELPDTARNVEFSADGRRFLIACKGGTIQVGDTAQLLDPGRRREMQLFLHAIRASEKGVNEAKFSPNGRLIAAACEDNAVRLFDAVSGRQLFVWGGFPGEARCVAFSPNGRLVVGGACDSYGVGDTGRDKLKLWNASTGLEVGALESRAVNHVVFSPDGTSLYTAQGYGQFTRINVRDGHSVWPAANRQGEWHLDISGDGRLAVTCDGGDLLFWDVTTGRLIRSISSGLDDIKGIHFSPDGHLLLYEAQQGDQAVCDAMDLTWPASLTAFQQRLDNRGDLGRGDLGRDKASQDLLLMGEWYAFRGMDEWAIDLLDRARTAGATVSPLMLGRCLWRQRRGDRTVQEFTRSESQGEAPEAYLRCCAAAAAERAASAPGALSLETERNSAAALASANKLDEAIDRYTRLLGENPRDAASLTKRALLYAHMGRYQDSVADYAKAVEADPGNHWNWYYLTGMRLYLDDVDGYRRDRQRMLLLFSNTRDPSVAERVAKASLLRPVEADAPDDAKPSKEMIDLAVAADNESYHWGTLTFGLSEYRAGHFDKAIERLEPIRGKMGNSIAANATIDLILAMAQHRLGHAKEASDLLQAGLEAVNRLPRTPNVEGDGIENWLIAQIIRREAEATVGEKN